MVMSRVLFTTTVSILSLAGQSAVVGGADEFAIPWHTIDAGGGVVAGGDFMISGTIGQPDAGTCTGGAFTLTGGFWAAPPHPQAAGDCNGDGTVGLYDFACLADCLQGPQSPMTSECTTPDLDSDGDVDLRDFSLMIDLFRAE